jgi:hypothetical protein
MGGNKMKDYSLLYDEVWRFHKKHLEKKETELDYAKIREEANSISNDIGGVFIRDILDAVILELKRNELEDIINKKRKQNRVNANKSTITKFFV